jgi:transposase
MAKPLMAALPELGKGSDPRISPWVGLAPLNRDRGKDRGARTIWGGRAHVRAALYRGALVAVQHEPVWKAF